MERHDTTMRAARYVLGAGTLAVAMVAMAADGASAQETDFCFGEDSFVCGHVFTDVAPSADNTFQMGEGVDTVTVVLRDATTHTEVATPESNPLTPGDCIDKDQLGCGYYEFHPDNPGNYEVCVIVNGVVTDCRPVTDQFEDFEIEDDGENQEVKDTEAPYNVYGAGTGTPGYWKNHPDEWPDEGVTIGGLTYSIDAAIQLMGKVSKDKSVTMFASLVSAKLNTSLSPLLGNNYDCIAATLLQADDWMADNPVGSEVKGSSAEWLAGEPLHSKLDDYNNGKLCAPHRN